MAIVARICLLLSVVSLFLASAVHAARCNAERTVKCVAGTVAYTVNRDGTLNKYTGRQPEKVSAAPVNEVTVTFPTHVASPTATAVKMMPIKPPVDDSIREQTHNETVPAAASSVVPEGIEHLKRLFEVRNPEYHAESDYDLRKEGLKKGGVFELCCKFSPPTTLLPVEC